jgi:plasmid replication initiation protein
MARIKKKKPLASLIVTQANELVESRYNLTMGEQRLIFTMISRIQPEDEDFKPYRISLGELAEFLGIDKNHIYADCKKITKKLLEKVVEIQELGRLLQTHWVSSADYIDGTGVVNLTFDPLLKPYLLQLKGNFTSSKLDMLLSFKRTGVSFQ